MAFGEVGIGITWQGAGVDEVGKDTASGKTLIHVDPKYFRPTEVETLLGDASKAKTKLGWEAKTSLAMMVKEMVAQDLKSSQKDELCRREGYQVFDYYE